MNNSDVITKDLAEKIYHKQFEIDPDMKREYDDRQKKLLFDDILYSLEFLFTAMEFDDDKIFEYYAVWIYQLLFNMIKPVENDRIKEQMITHYKVSEAVLKEALSEEEAIKASHHLKNAIKATIKESRKYDHYPTAKVNPSSKYSYQFQTDSHYVYKTEYLTALLNYNTKEAYKIIQNARDQKVPIVEIYQDILQEVMYVVGELWHQSVITVDQEHYCTAVTQTILSNFYPEIFSQPSKSYRLIAGTIGSELHEIGARMISDLFQYHGWDSIYLGAGVPEEAILSAIDKNQPDLLVLSVTMPQHIRSCHEIVKSIKLKYPHVKVAVGGSAFSNTDKIWEKLGVDIYTKNAKDLLAWAEKHIVQSKVIRYPIK